MLPLSPFPLPSLRLAFFRFDLEALAPLLLPPFKGSTLRGGFGYVFKKTVCVQPPALTPNPSPNPGGGESPHPPPSPDFGGGRGAGGVGEGCAPCLLRWTCAYPYLFESSPPPGAEVLRKNEDVPQPFVIEPPLDTRTEIPAGEPMAFNLALVGKAVDYLPYFIVVFRELGNTGLGSRTGKYALRGVSAFQPFSGSECRLYDGQNLLVQSGRAPLEITAEMVQTRASTLPADRLTLHFLTPTRLKHADRFVRVPEFHVLVRALLRRISSLAYFHCGERWETDYTGLIARAQTVRLAENRTHWVDWERWSGRQEQRMNLGGLVGKATYEGNLTPFLPLLAAGELLHVGKATAFGNGKYRILDFGFWISDF